MEKSHGTFEIPVLEMFGKTEITMSCAVEKLGTNFCTSPVRAAYGSTLSMIDFATRALF